MKKIKNFLKKMGKSYLDGCMEMYGPALKCGINPFI